MHKKVFLDTSVVIAAVLSLEGGSGLIFKLARKKYIEIVLTKRVVQEAHFNLTKKYNDEAVLVLINLLSDFKTAIKPTLNDKECAKYQDLIVDQKDCHILAGAEKYRTEYLLTLDRKHFFTDKLKSADLSFSILTPGDFLRELRKESI